MLHVIFYYVSYISIFKNLDGLTFILFFVFALNKI